METSLKTPTQLFVQPIRYEVPKFQRRYVWDQSKQWEPLWDDIRELAQSIIEGDSQRDKHFMGAVVLQQSRHPTGTLERRIVVDGQQRLITLQLLLKAIQFVLEKLKCSEDAAARLKEHVVNRKAFRDDNSTNAFKIWPSLVDIPAFQAVMGDELSGNEHSASQVEKAYAYFREQTNSWLSGFTEPDRQRAAQSLEKAVLNGMQLVTIDLEEQDDPHIIFETMNARGTPPLTVGYGKEQNHS